jgi:hypothetical protein
MILLVICCILCWCYIGLSFLYMNDVFYEQHFTILFLINFLAWVCGVTSALAIMIKLQLGDY